MSDFAQISRRTLLASTFLIGIPPAFAASRPTYKDPQAPVSARVQDLLSRMTLDEKVAQVCCLWFGKDKLRDGDVFSAKKAASSIPNGIGQLGSPSDSFGTSLLYKGVMYLDPEVNIAFVNDVQRYLTTRTRLGIPALFHEETAHGFKAKGATIFPVPPALGSTWDPDLVEQAFAVAGREARLRGGTVALSPVVDLMREPRYGRTEEFFGEDPYLVGEMGLAAVRGQQGPRPLGKDKLFCTLKHFVHGAPQGGLNRAPAASSDRDLRENYLVPFVRIVRDGDPAVIMPSYNEVEGVPAHENRELLQGIGRKRLRFRGAYFSDYGGIENLIKDHHVAKDADEAAILALNAGVDADLPDGTCYSRLAPLVRSGRASQTKLDEAVGRILALKFEAGLFENPYIDPRRAMREVNTPADVALARKVAQKALILLKNDGTLPIDPEAAIKIALIGPNSVEPLLGGYSGENAKSVGLMAGLRAAAGSRLSIEQSDGVWISKPDTRGGHSPQGDLTIPSAAENATRIAEAIKVARRADIIVLAVGDNPQITREAVRGPGDRSTLGLFGQQDDLVEAMIAIGKPIIAILLNGRPLAVTRLAEKANALIEGWYLGQEGGNALADVIFGKVNPGGKLTVSIPRGVGELPAFYNRHPSSDVNTYVEEPRGVLYPFGHGLSYTQFQISPPRLSATTISQGQGVQVEVDLDNTGNRGGDEVVQLYIRDEVSSVPRPIMELKAFRRVALAPGEKKTIRFDLKPDDFAFWDIAMRWVVEPGSFKVLVGNSSASLKAATLTFTDTPSA